MESAGDLSDGGPQLRRAAAQAGGRYWARQKAPQKVTEVHRPSGGCKLVQQGNPSALRVPGGFSLKGNAMTDENEQLNNRAALLLNDPTQPETEAEIAEVIVAVFSCESGDLT